MTLNYEKRFKELADGLAVAPISEPALERRVLSLLWVVDDDTGPRARANRERAIEQVLAIFRGRGEVGDTTGNSPGTNWVAFNAIAERVADAQGVASERTAAATSELPGGPSKDHKVTREVISPPRCAHPNSRGL